MKRLRMFPVRLLAGLCLAALPVAACGADLGYWACSGGQWIAVGAPTYSRPLRDCVEKPSPPKTEARCDALGGTWKPIGIFPAPVCRVPTRDAGRTCGDADECDSTCLAKLSTAQIDVLRQGATIPTLGRCAPAYPVVGCLATVERGAVQGLLCLD
jgi:hypothetical protein